MPKPDIKEVPVRAVLRVECCRECGSDNTRYASSRDDNGLYLNKCHDCGTTWRSTHASGDGVHFYREDATQQLLR